MFIAILSFITWPLNFGVRPRPFSLSMPYSLPQVISPMSMAPMIICLLMTPKFVHTAPNFSLSSRHIFSIAYLGSPLDVSSYLKVIYLRLNLRHPLLTLTWSLSIPHLGGWYLCASSGTSQKTSSHPWLLWISLPILLLIPFISFYFHSYLYKGVLPLAGQLQ